MITKLIREIESIIQAQQKGISDTYIDIDLFDEEYDGEYKKTAITINHLLQEMRREKDRITIAEENSQAKSRFLARMSHEIRTPISTVLGVAEIQLKNPNHPLHTEEAFAKIYSSANSLLSIVNDILDLSKVEAGKMAIIENKYDVANLIIDAAQLQLVHIGNKQIDFQVEIDKNIPTQLIGDELRIKQIMNNLLSNAFKYTDSGTVKLSMAGKKGPNDDAIILEIIVEDTGLGMTQSQLNGLSADYSRFHERDNRSIGGTGLGMPIVYHLVSLMGAEINIQSEVCEGTVVAVEIPQHICGNKVLGPEFVNNLHKADILSRSRKTSIIPTPMPYGKVLAVDDLEANLYVIEGLLRFYEIKVETCKNGNDVIEKIRAGNNYDIIFMDHVMPKPDGVETTRFLRNMGYNGPIVALSANALIGQAEEFFKNGFDGFISKPIQAARLDEVLKKFVASKQVVHHIRPTDKFSDKQNVEDFLSESELIEKIRLDFIKTQKDIIPDIWASALSGDYKTAYRLAHNMKGFAALIKENKLSKVAEAVEGQLKKEELTGDITELESELSEVLARITPVNGPTSTPIIKLDSTSKRAAQELSERLETLLDDSNVECLGLMEDLMSLPGTELLVEQIDNFEFKLATETLYKWKNMYL